MKLRLLFFITITSLTLKAQSKWTVGVIFRPDAGNRHLVLKNDSNAASNIIRMRNDNETSRLCYTAGIGTRHDLSKNLFLESGIYISDKGYQTIAIPVVTLNNPDPVINFSTMQFVYHHFYIDIPITAHYQFQLNEKNHFQIGAGICNSLKTDVYQTSYFTDAFGATTSQKSTDKDRYNYQTYLLSSVFCARIERHIIEQLSLSIELKGQYANSTTIKSNNIGEHLWTIGMGIGAWWKL